MQVGTTKDQGLYNKPSAAVHPGILAAGTLLQYNTIFVITFKRGVYNYIHSTNRVTRVNSVAAVLYLQFVLHVMLFRMFNMFCTFTLALSPLCSAQYVCFLYFLNFVPSRYFSRILSE